MKFNGHRSCDKTDNSFMKIPEVTNDNNLHNCIGPATGCLVCYFIFMNIDFTKLISVCLFEVFFISLQKLAISMVLQQIFCDMFSLSDLIKCCLYTFLLH